MALLSRAQRTLRRGVMFRGVGLHSGQVTHMRIMPVHEPDFGIRFERVDAQLLAHGAHRRHRYIRASWQNVVSSTLCTVLGTEPMSSLHRTAPSHRIRDLLDASIVGRAHCVWTVEHVLAALYASRVDNALVQLDGAEVPILDGSAQPFLASLSDNTVDLAAFPTARRIVVMRDVFHVGHGGQWGKLSPRRCFQESERSLTRAHEDDELSISVQVEFAANSIVKGSGVCSFAVSHARDHFAPMYSAARTFCLREQLSMMWVNGLARGGSRRNALIFENGTAEHGQTCRYTDEAVRHKALDALGDLALANGSLVAHYSARRPSHALNVQLLRALFSNDKNYRTVGCATTSSTTQSPCTEEAQVLSHA